MTPVAFAVLASVPAISGIWMLVKRDFVVRWLRENNQGMGEPRREIVILVGVLAVFLGIVSVVLVIANAGTSS